MKQNPFLGRSLAVINDLNLDERMYLFQKARDLKHSIKLAKHGRAKILNSFQTSNPYFGVYEVFLEPSTRTAHSFLNAAQFFGAKLNILQADHSSFTKSESYVDAFNNLTGYDNSIFIVRSKLEGLCRWLERSGLDYAKRNGLLVPSVFINGGDGKHEHPTQELLDDYTFLEDNNWNNDHIHVALIGDLLHGRTVHSKVDGLKIFNEVQVDLVAPNELSMPDSYVDRMKANGFEIRTFESLDEYLNLNTKADKWYFTRPQLERMGEDILRRADELRSHITFREEWLDKVKKGTKFYHPLPRHKQHATIPLYLDNTLLNGWERQSANGRYVRIVLLGMMAGVIGDDYRGEISKKREFVDDFFEEIKPSQHKKHYHEGINPIKNGVAIDHICKGETPEEIWNYLSKVVSIMKFHDVGYVGVGKSKNDGQYNGMIFLPNHEELSDMHIKKLAAISPCTYNLVDESRILRKTRLKMPPRIYGFSKISCKNESCISYPSHYEGCPTEFHRNNDTFDCMYCETPHTFKEIWK